MKIRIFNKFDIEKYEEVMPHLVISIKEPNSPGCDVPRANLPENQYRMAELYLDFCDMDCRKNSPERLTEVGYKLFCKDDARAILGIVKLMERDISVVLINCSGGISRSAGVGAALSLLTGEGDARFFDPKGPYNPNRFVYRTILDVAIAEGFYAAPS
jgi:predicted protein tyrosine phosphatase